MTKDSKNYFAHPTAVIDEGCSIGEGTKIWHFCHFMSGCTIGPECNFGQNVAMASGVRLGRRVKVQNHVSFGDGVTCEDDVFIGPSVSFTNVLNPRSAVNRRGQYLETIIRRGVSIGANAVIMCDIEIGEYAFIGAGAVVTKSVLPYALVVGNPARQIGWMSRDGYRLHFQDGVAECPEEGCTYRLNGTTVTREEKA